MTPTPKLFSRRLLPVALSTLALLGLPGMLAQSAHAEYKSRLSQLLIHPASLYMPTRLIIGQQTRFVVKAPAGNLVKVFISPKDTGYSLPNGTALRVGSEAKVLSGTVPVSGVLELTLDMPAEVDLVGKALYVDAVAGASEDSLAQVDLVDATGRRADENALVIYKPAEKGGSPIMPGMPGLNPQMFNQLTQMGEIYTNKNDSRKDLLDNGDIDKTRTMDQNPFINRGVQQGLQSH